MVLQLAQLLEKFIRRDVTIDVGDETYEILHALNFVLPQEQLEREVFYDRVEGNPSDLLVWFTDSKRGDPDFILHNVPVRGRPKEGKKTGVFTLDEDIMDVINALPEGQRSKFVSDALRQSPRVAVRLKK